MYCRICGDTANVKYYPGKRQALCPHCSKDTPRKVSRENFDRQYWSGDSDAPEGIRREFYADYLASSDTVQQYIEKH